MPCDAPASSLFVLLSGSTVDSQITWYFLHETENSSCLEIPYRSQSVLVART